MTPSPVATAVMQACEDIEQPTGRECALTDSQRQISAVCDDVKAMLLEKNRKYGDSALAPVRILSHASPEEAIRVRIDDKLSRICHEQDDEDEDVINDLIGYLILLKVAQLRSKYAFAIPGPEMAVI